MRPGGFVVIVRHDLTPPKSRSPLAVTSRGACASPRTPSGHGAAWPC